MFSLEPGLLAAVGLEPELLAVVGLQPELLMAVSPGSRLLAIIGPGLVFLAAIGSESGHMVVVGLQPGLLAMAVLRMGTPGAGRPRVWTLGGVGETTAAQSRVPWGIGDIVAVPRAGLLRTGTPGKDLAEALRSCLRPQSEQKIKVLLNEFLSILIVTKNGAGFWRRNTFHCIFK
eukprot:g34813.t1